MEVIPIDHCICLLYCNHRHSVFVLNMGTMYNSVDLIEIYGVGSPAACARFKPARLMPFLLNAMW